jgi:uncharacterized protein (TIRG00374 family)
LKKTLRNLLQILLFFGVGAGILWLVYRDQNAAWQAQCALDGIPADECSLIGKILDDFASANYFWLFLVLVAFTISNMSRMARWRMLLQPMGYVTKPLNGFFTIMLGYFANLGFPRIGEVVRAGTFARYEKIDVEKVMGTVVVDRVADVISLALVMALAFALEFDQILALLRSFQDESSTGSGGFSWVLWVLAGLAFLGILTVVLVFIFWDRWKTKPLFVRIRKIATGFLDGIKTISKLERPGLFILHSANIWFMYYLMTYLGFQAFGPTQDLGLMPALMVFVVGALGIVIPSPGGMGTYHALVTACLVSMYGIEKADGFSFANILFFSIQLGCNILLGVLALVILPAINRSATEEAVPLANQAGNPD